MSKWGGTYDKLQLILEEHRACEDPREWLHNSKFDTFAEAFAACPNILWIDWLVMMLAQYGKSPDALTLYMGGRDNRQSERVEDVLTRYYQPHSALVERLIREYPLKKEQGAPMKYKLSTILFKMGPCDDAHWWITNSMQFETFKEAVEACPNPRWLMWVLLHTESPKDSFSSKLPNEMWNISRVLRFDAPNGSAELKKLFLDPAYLERFAYAIIQYAKREGIKPT